MMGTVRYGQQAGGDKDAGERPYAGIAASLQVGDTVDCVIRGNCMLPVLGDGQRVTLRKQRRYCTGDIIFFTDQQGNPLIHRYLGRVPDGRLMTKADRAEKIDVLVPVGQVLGKATNCDGRRLTISSYRRLLAFIHYQGWLLKLSLGRVGRARVNH